jgi:IS30 family transposase
VHLTHEKRFTIETLNSKDFPYIMIAEIIGRHLSSSWRERKRKAHTN